MQNLASIESSSIWKQGCYKIVQSQALPPFSCHDVRNKSILITVSETKSSGALVIARWRIKSSQFLEGLSLSQLRRILMKHF